MTNPSLQTEFPGIATNGTIDPTVELVLRPLEHGPLDNTPFESDGDAASGSEGGGGGGGGGGGDGGSLLSGEIVVRRRGQRLPTCAFRDGSLDGATSTSTSTSTGTSTSTSTGTSTSTSTTEPTCAWFRTGDVGVLDYTSDKVRPHAAAAYRFLSFFTPAEPLGLLPIVFLLIITYCFVPRPRDRPC